MVFPITIDTDSLIYGEGGAGASKAKEIYQYTTKAINPGVELTRYDVPKAGLLVLSRHAGQFVPLLAENYENIYNSIVSLCRHKNKELQRPAFAALESFLREMSGYIVRSGQNKKGKKMFKFFFLKFREIIEAKESTGAREMSIAIRGYGYLAAPCRNLMKEKDLRIMFSDMAQRCEQIFFSGDEGEDDVVHLASYIDAIASIVQELDNVGNMFLSVLERLVILLFDVFPQYHMAQRKGVYSALKRVFIGLYPKGPVLEAFLSRVLYQGLLRVCSNPTITSTAETIVQQEYVELFHSMLSRGHIRVTYHDFPEPDRIAMSTKLYDEFIKVTLQLIEKLDLSTRKTDRGPAAKEPAEDADFAESDPLAHLNASVPKDFQVFIALVDFFERLLPRMHAQRFVSWIPVVGKSLIQFSAKFPLVSGFYKLLQTLLDICRKVGYFKTIGKIKVIAKDVRETFDLFLKFIREVQLRSKMYKDELLASCVRLTLALPREFLVEDIDAAVPAMTTALKLGLGYPPLAKSAVDALERWVRSLPHKQLGECFTSIMPYVDIYLKIHPDKEGSAADDELREITRSLQTKKSRKVAVTDEESPLNKVRTRLVRILGEIGGENTQTLVDLGNTAGLGSKSDEAPPWMAWDREKHVQFDIPFKDMKPSVYLDSLLPRVVELAKDSSDRQIKVAACEMLHAVVLYMIGNSASQPGEDKTARTDMSVLFTKIFPGMLSLSVDVEVVAKQLFSKLMMQIIHWFTNNRQYESPETIALLSAIFGGLVNPSDAAVRDFSALCLAEFLQWSIKQNKKAGPTDNAKSVLKRVYSLALHPGLYQRIGAALAINAIYRVLRRDKDLVNIFAMEILVMMMVSLRHADQDDPDLKTTEQTVLAIKHVEKMIVHEIAIFRKSSKKRRVPPNWDDAELSTLIKWCFLQCARRETEVRHRSVALFLSLSPMEAKSKSPADWVSSMVQEEGIEFVMQIAEPFKTPIPDPATASRSDILKWFSQRETSFDNYTWMISEQCIVAQTLIPNDSPLFAHMEAFLTNFAVAELPHISDTPRELALFKQARCDVAMKLMTLARTLSNKRYSSAQFWTTELCDLIVTAILDPSQIGFDLGNHETSQRLPKLATNLIISVTEKLKGKPAALLSARIENHLSDKRNDLYEILKKPESIQEDSGRILELVSGYEQLHASGLLIDNLPRHGAGSLPEKILTILFDATSTVARREKKADGENEKEGAEKLFSLTSLPKFLFASNKLLGLSFSLNLSQDKLKERLMNEEDFSPTDVAADDYLEGDPNMDVDTPAKFRHKTTKGSMFFNTFRQPICAFVARQFKFFAPILIPKAESHNVGPILHGALKELRVNGELTTYRTEFALNFLSSFHSLSKWWSDAVGTNTTKIEAMTLLYELLSLEIPGDKLGKHEAFEDVKGLFDQFCDDRSLKLREKIVAFRVLPYLLAAGAYTDQIIASVEKLMRNHFPVRSDEYPVGSPERGEYLSAVENLCSALAKSGNPELLRLIVNMVCKEREQHIHENYIQRSLGKFALNPVAKVQEACESCFELFLNEDKPMSLREAACRRILCTLLLTCPDRYVLSFFESNIRQLASIITEKLRPQSAPDLPNQLISKTAAFDLMRVMYSRLKPEHVNAPNAEVNNAFKGAAASEKGNDLTKLMCGPTGLRGALCEYVAGLPPKDPTTELRRLFHCAAYNALAALIRCTQTKEKFFYTFLFKENPAKGEKLLENIVDLNRDYEFPVELDHPTEIRTGKITALREGQLGQVAGSAGPKYLPSQMLADSSLSQDVASFRADDAPISSNSNKDGEGGETQSQSQVTSASTQGSAPGQPDSEVYNISEGDLDMDAWNKHESMPTLLSIIDVLEHLKKLEAGDQPAEPPAEGDDEPELIKPSDEEMPSWMKALYGKMVDPDSHHNVRLFVTKVICNRPKVFQPWASQWIRPLIQQVLWFDKQNHGFNYFVTDICVVMLSWAQTAVPDNTEGRLASMLLDFLMRNTRHDNHAVLKNNINIVKLMVERWKKLFDVVKGIPTFTIYTNFAGKDINSKWNLPGIHLLSTILANGFPAFNSETQIKGLDKPRFFKALVGNLTFKSVTVYRPAAAVLGMALRHLAFVEKEKDSPVFGLVEEVLYGCVKPVLQADRLLVCLHNICNAETGFPPMCDKFMQQLLYLLPTVNGVFKVQLLELILWRVDDVPKVFQELKSKNVLELLSHNEPDVQAVMLRIMKKLFGKLSLPDIQYAVPTMIETFPTHIEMNCRLLFYESFVALNDRQNRMDVDDLDDEEGDELSPQQTKELFDSVRACLIRGLADKSASVRESMFAFWNHETRLSLETLQRLKDVVVKMYSPASEEYFLQYGSYLLLQLTSQSPDYERPMFDHPLKDCEWHSLPINASWNNRNLHMTPLFAATQSSQSQGDDDEEDVVPAGFLMATQQGATSSYSQTGTMGTYNPGSISQRGTYGTQSGTQQILLFKRRRAKNLGPTFGATQATQGDGATPSQAMANREVRHLRRRFISSKSSKTAGGGSNFWMRRALDRQRKLRMFQEARKKARHAQIMMHRSYRDGELPDIQIKTRELVTPLQALVQRDATTAKLVFSLLFETLYHNIDGNLSAREAADLKENIHKGLEHILENSTQAYTPCIAGIEELCAAVSIPIRPETVSSASIASQTYHSGILLMEHQLLSGNEPEHTTKRKRKGGRGAQNFSSDLAAWLELGKLYRPLDDFDVLRGIFAQEIGAQPETIHALEVESEGDYYAAAKIYQNALQKEDDDWPDGPVYAGEVHMWEDARANCLRQLCQWDLLETAVMQNIDPSEEEVDVDTIWSQKRLVDYQLPMFMESALKMCCDRKTKDEYVEKLGSFLERALAEPARRDVLEQRFPHQLIVYYIASESFDRARHYEMISTEAFVQQWSGLHPLMSATRRNVLQKVQPLVEAKEFLEFVHDDNNFGSVYPVERLLKKWHTRYPASITDSLSAWTDVISTRSLYLQILKEEFDKRHPARKRKRGGTDPQDIVNKASLTMNVEEIEMLLKFSKEACEQRGYRLAVKSIRQANVLLNTLEKSPIRNRLQVMQSQATAHYRFGVCTSPEKTTAFRLTAYSRVVQKLKAEDKFIKEADPENQHSLFVKNSMLRAAALENLAKLLSEDGGVDSLEDEAYTNIAECINVRDKAKLAGECCKHAFESFCQPVELKDDKAHKADPNKLPPGWKAVPSRSRPGQFSYLNMVSKQRQAQVPTKSAYGDTPSKGKSKMVVPKDNLDEEQMEAYYSLSKFCDECISGDLAVVSGFTLDSEMLPKIMIQSLLTAMRNGSIEARQRFPRLLQLLSDDSSLIGTFVEAAKNVPSWMFIGWIAQMVAILDKPSAPAIHDILSRIAKEYPGALCFPILTSSDQFDFSKRPASDRKAFEDLKHTLRNDLLTDLISALEQLTNPEHVLKDWLKDDLDPLMAVPKEKRNKAAIKATFDQMKEELLNTRNQHIGKFRRDFANQHGKLILKHLEPSKLPAMAEGDYRKKCQSIVTAIREAGRSNKEPRDLKDYSPFLSGFQGSDFDTAIEIPGQYDGKSKPIPSYHATIENFDKRVLVLRSMRRPKRLVFRGNDEKDYPFLIKGGEDLRLDQRIQQLFHIMNSVMKRDAECSQRNLALRTYQVVPLTSRIGVIEWMSHTVVLKELITSSMSDHEKQAFGSRDEKHNPQLRHQNWIGSSFKGSYMKLMQASRTDVAKEFDVKQHMVRDTLLRDALRSFSASAEAYLTTRTHFVRTLATVNICQYLLGIGDRHLSNFMVDINTGGLIGIDFGHAFGSATQFLGVPEMMPFRLTRQFEGVLQPHSREGLLKHTMIHVLQAMRNNHDLLLATMDVFVNEPLLDWQQFAKKEEKAKSAISDAKKSNSDTWYPEEKIKYAKRKLMLTNPCYITADELSLGHTKNPNLKYMVDIVKGKKGGTVRSGVNEICDSVAQQVACLLDQACDPNILGRTWGGWEPWV